MKTRSMVCADIAQSDLFLGMSLEAQLLYFLILFHADVTGRIYGAGRICRGYGFDSDSLKELYDNGYLLDVDGLTVDAHCWRNNKLDGRLKTRVDSWEAFSSGRITFVGEAFKSSYQLNDVASTETRRNGDGDTAPNTTQLQQQPNDNGNHKASEAQPQTQLQNQCGTVESVGVRDNGSESMGHPCMCRICGSTNAHYWMDEGGTHIGCPECGTYDYML